MFQSYSETLRMNVIVFIVPSNHLDIGYDFVFDREFTWRTPLARERIFDRPDGDWVGVPTEHFRAGFRPRMHRFVFSLFRDVLKIAIAQMHPNDIRLINRYMSACYVSRKLPSFAAFFELFTVQNSKTPFAVAGSKLKNNKPVNNPTNIRDWIREFLFVKGGDLKWTPCFAEEYDDSFLKIIRKLSKVKRSEVSDFVYLAFVDVFERYDFFGSEKLINLRIMEGEVSAAEGHGESVDACHGNIVTPKDWDLGNALAECVSMSQLLGFLDVGGDEEDVTKIGEKPSAASDPGSDDEPLVSMVAAKGSEKKKKKDKKRKDVAEDVDKKKKKKQKLDGEGSSLILDVEASCAHLVFIIEELKRTTLENVELHRELSGVRKELDGKSTELTESMSSFTVQVAALEFKIKGLEEKIEEYRSNETRMKEIVEKEKGRANSAEKLLEDAVKNEKEVVAKFVKGPRFKEVVRKSSQAKLKSFYNQAEAYFKVAGEKSFDGFAMWQNVEAQKKKEAAMLRAAGGGGPVKSGTQSHI